ncbi:Uncharacterised protein [Candidatus Bilamarchaeum dharawalense]|uniref:Uncharacterized protein n=1 Tax=Candidatus Bilamarchaeum dharawalense TaxID=2885759 RepID=A0A5E4LXP6_9ARCH|nr:Uncharacterised protein [Candidatus Bilamarchaeum dharawalense]
MSRQEHVLKHNEIIGHATVSIKFSKLLFFSTTYQATLFRYTGNGYNFKVYAIVSGKEGDRIVGTVNEDKPVAGGHYTLSTDLPHKSYLDLVLAAYARLKNPPKDGFKDKEPLS